MLISIQADHRENPSGIPELLAGNAGVSLIVSALPAGDYIINGTIGIERKSAEDFVQSIIANRLFDQIARLKRSAPRPLLIVEGNPYMTAHKIQDCAIRGAPSCLFWSPGRCLSCFQKAGKIPLRYC